MRESTDLRCTELAETPGSPLSADAQYFAKPLFFLDSSDFSAEDWFESAPASDNNSVDMSACEFVYGIPFQLIANHGQDLRTHSPQEDIHQTLSSFCITIDALYHLR
jgi:hypothetical protein